MSSLDSFSEREWTLALTSNRKSRKSQPGAPLLLLAAPSRWPGPTQECAGGPAISTPAFLVFFYRPDPVLPPPPSTRPAPGPARLFWCARGAPPPPATTTTAPAPPRPSLRPSLRPSHRPSLRPCLSVACRLCRSPQEQQELEGRSGRSQPREHIHAVPPHQLRLYVCQKLVLKLAALHKPALIFRLTRPHQMEVNRMAHFTDGRDKTAMGAPATQHRFVTGIVCSEPRAQHHATGTIWYAHLTCTASNMDGPSAGFHTPTRPIPTI
jgi:hypothetical protein